MSTTTITRRPRWHPNLPPPQTPKILNLPRRTRRKQPRNAAAKPKVQGDFQGNSYRGRLEVLFDQERTFSKTVPVVLLNSGRRTSDVGGRRERVEECEDSSGGGGGGGFLEEKWRFQAEILRAECNFLRMEREFALKKLERNRVQMERTLRSAVQTLVSGRKKMSDGKIANTNILLEEEIEDLEEKLEELKRSSQMKDIEVKKSSNFDKKASLLQRRLEKLVGLDTENPVKETGQIAESSFSVNMNHQIHVEGVVSTHKKSNKFHDSVQVEVLKRKLEGVSMGMLNRMEDECYESTPATSSAASSSASTSKRIEFPDLSSFSTRQPHQEENSKDEKKCSGRCKAIVQRIVEQVKAETDQWSQMQEMLGQVRQEMEELQVSRDFWEDRALDSDYQIQSLRSTVKVWEDKALTFETKANELQTEVCALREEVESLRKSQKEEARRAKVSEPLSLGAHIAKERILVCRTKENHNPNEKIDLRNEVRRKVCTCSDKIAAPRRTPFRNLENLSPKVRQNVRAVFPLQSPEPSIGQKSF